MTYAEASAAGCPGRAMMSSAFSCFLSAVMLGQFCVAYALLRHPRFLRTCTSIDAQCAERARKGIHQGLRCFTRS
jgi:hypothetical protein